MLIPEIHFINDDTAFAVGDNRLTVFKGSQTPIDGAGHIFDKEIQAVFYGEKYIGLVFGSDDGEHAYKLEIYNSDGKKARSYYFDLDYTDILFEEEDFVIYNESKCQIITYGGVEKFNGSFTKAAELLLPTKSAYKYTMVTSASIDTIQLK